MKFIDLFSGIGGFRLALESRVLECVFSSEIDPYAKEAYAMNFNDEPSGDITKIQANEIPKHDILCGGFPCQSFSVAGKYQGFNDNRGNLFFEIVRIAEHHKPLVLLLENVRGILSVNNKQVIKLIYKELDKIGYNVYHHVLNSSYFGIPQSRIRCYFVCLRKNEKLYSFQPTGTYEKIYLQDILEPNPNADLFLRTKKEVEITKEEKYIKNKLKIIRVGKYGCGKQRTRIYSAKGHAITQCRCNFEIPSSVTSNYTTPEGIRALSLSECKAVMGFPKNHIVGGKKIIDSYNQLANAVIPKMIGVVWDNIEGLKN